MISSGEVLPQQSRCFNTSMTQDGHCYDKDDEQATHLLEVHLTNFMGFFSPQKIEVGYD